MSVVKKPVIGFIGAGFMGAALIDLIGCEDRYHILAADSKKRVLDSVAQRYKVECLDTKELVLNSEVLILAVKPQDLLGVVTENKELLCRKRPLVVSIAAGLEVVVMQEALDSKMRIARVMPNLLMSLKRGISGVYLNHNCSSEDQTMVRDLFCLGGGVIMCNEEKELDMITAVTGSGPGYVFHLLNAFQHAAEQIGMNHNQAKKAATLTFLGAAEFCHNHPDLSFEALQMRVCSKGGTTQKAIETFDRLDLTQTFAQGVQAAFERSKELKGG